MADRQAHEAQLW